MKEFYKFSICTEHEGLGLWLHKYVSFHETPCYHYCVSEYDKSSISPLLVRDDESMLQSIKRRGKRFLRVHKTCSRKAFDTKEQAYKNFMFLKERQIAHMQRDLKVLNRLVKFNKEMTFDDLKDEGHMMLLPNTSEFIHDVFTFD